ncbi:MAG: TRAP transporter large permease subunit [Sneathiellaceae bacterium]
MSAIEIGAWSLLAMVLLVVSGLHIAVALILLSLAGIWLIRGNFDIALSLLGQAMNDAIAGQEFGVVPLFVLMGLLVGVAGIGKDMFDVADRMLRRLRGGVGIATVFANAGFAATTGISIASAAVFARISVPEMLRFGYNPRFAVGVVAGSSVLGMLIPPSLLMILYAFLAEQSVGAMFLSGVLPGILLTLVFCGGILLIARVRPGYIGGTARGLQDGLVRGDLGRMVPIVLLVGLVLGGIYGGLFTATEAGAVGATGALLIALQRRQLDLAGFWRVLIETGHITVSVLFLIIAANLYSRMLALSGLPQAIVQAMVDAELGVAGFLAMFVVLVLVLGFIIDSASILLITVPLMLPVAQALGIDLVWLGVITIIAVEIGLLTPPFGLVAYVVKGTVDDDRITLVDVFAGAAPFALMMLLTLLVIIAFPWLATALV